MWKKIKPYVVPYSVAIAIPVGVGLMAAWLTKDNMDIYEVKIHCDSTTLLYAIIHHVILKNSISETAL